MADTVKSSSELKLVMNFYDSDDRTLTVPNPKSNLTAAEIKAVGAIALSTQAVIGDKTGAAFVGFKSANKKQKTVTNLDLR